MEDRDGNVGGIAVHVTARLLAEAGDGSVVSTTTRDLATGSGFEFTDLRERDLKGIPGTWRIFRLAD